jgi:Uma2 family endonuclease
MALAVPIPVHEYLGSTYDPDRDYVDGVIVERKRVTHWHGLVQHKIAAIFAANRRTWSLRPITEQRLQVSHTRFRVADVCVVRASDRIDAILHAAPLLCVEVLSPEDRFQQIVIRGQEYQSMGVEHIWIIDPESREAWFMGDCGGPLPMLEDAFTLPGTPVRLTMTEIFEEIDAEQEEPLG